MIDDGPPPFFVYSIGLVFASVCTSLDDETATLRLNLQHPTGISSSWEICEHEFADHSSNPHPCNQSPDTHRHILFNC
jgi:hypothetical protein